MFGPEKTVPFFRGIGFQKDGDTLAPWFGGVQGSGVGEWRLQFDRAKKCAIF
jgi:hypothetical protein